VALADLRELNVVTGKVIAAGIEVHRVLGPGLLEAAYLACMVTELREHDLDIEVQRALPLIYKNVTVPCAFRVDLLVSGCVVVELKCVSEFLAIHQAQLLTYLKLTGCPVGLLMNFQVPVLKQGIRRVLNTPDNAGGLRGPADDCGRSPIERH